MAIARVANSTLQNAVGTSLSLSYTVAAGSDRKLRVGILENISGYTSTNVTGVTFNGVALTKLVEHYRTFSDGQMCSIWELDAPGVTTADVVVSLSVSTDVYAIAANYTGAEQAAPTGNALKTFSSNSASSASMSPTSVVDDSWAFSIFRNLDGSISDGTNYVGFNNSSIEVGDSNAGMGSAGAETVEATTGGATRWGGCATALIAPAAAAADAKRLSLLGVGA